MKKLRGDATALVIVAVASLALLGIIAKPAWFPGASKRAAEAAKATAELAKAHDKQSAIAAASATEIGTANTMAPESPSKDFIAREVPVLLSRLQPPDPKELIEAGRRREAVMAGKIELIEKLYGESSKKTEKLVAHVAAMEARVAEANRAVERAAAAEHAASMQRYAFIGLALLVGALYLYRKVYSIGSKDIAEIVTDVRKGIPPLQAISENIGPRFFKTVQSHVKLATPLPDMPVKG